MAVSNDLFLNEKARLDVNSRTWEKEDIVSAKDLAKDGFVHQAIVFDEDGNKHDDAATCVFCGVTLVEWKKEDNVREEHKRNSSSCIFLTDENSTGNVPLDQNHEDWVAILNVQVDNLCCVPPDTPISEGDATFNSLMEHPGIVTLLKNSHNPRTEGAVKNFVVRRFNKLGMLNFKDNANLMKMLDDEVKPPLSKEDEDRLSQLNLTINSSSSSSGISISLKTEVVKTILGQALNSDEDLIIGVQGLLACINLLVQTAGPERNIRHLKLLKEYFGGGAAADITLPTLTTPITRHSNPTRIALETVLLHAFNEHLELSEHVTELAKKILVSKKEDFAQVNEVINNRTTGFIPQIVHANEAEGPAKVIIVSQTALEGDWAHSFSFEKRGLFYRSSDDTKTVDYFETTSGGNVKILKTEKVDAVSLPLRGDDGETGPRVLMIKPKVIHSNRKDLFDDIVSSIGSFDRLNHELFHNADKGGGVHYIQTPLFRFKSKTNLSEIIKKNSSTSNVNVELRDLLNDSFRFFKGYSAVESQYLTLETKADIKFTKNGIATRSRTLCCQIDGIFNKPEYPTITFDRPFAVITVDGRQRSAEASVFDVALVMGSSF